MPRLREGTLAAHRSVVHAAILDATGALVARGGLRAVTMSQVAADAGIGRATLYRYFPDVDALLAAWHERRLGQHLHQLAGLRHADRPALDRLAAVLSAFGSIRHQHPGVGEAAPLHGGEQVGRAHGRVLAMVHELVTAAAADGAVRTDVPPAELAAYCLASLGAAAELDSGEAVERLVAVTLDGLRPHG